MHIADGAVVVGLDVGKAFHHGHAVRADGQVLASRRVPNTQDALDAFLQPLQETGPVLVVVDQVGSLGAFAVAVVQQLGMTVGYLPGAQMRRLGDLAGESKTDARDAKVIAEATQAMADLVREVRPIAPLLTDLRILCGRDDDLVQQVTATTNRLRGMLADVHPGLERVIGPALSHVGVLDLLMKWPTPAKLAAAGPRRMVTLLRRHHARHPEVFVDSVRAALTAQTVVVPGTAALDLVLPQLAAQLLQLRDQRAAIGARMEEVLLGDPLSCILRSMPGFGVRITARTLVELAGKTFASAADLAADAGVAPVTIQSGGSIHRTRRKRGGNRALQAAWYRAAFSAISCTDPASRTYYDRKRREGKRHQQALLALARRRSDVLFAMIRDGALYHPSTPQPP